MEHLLTPATEFISTWDLEIGVVSLLLALFLLIYPQQKKARNIKRWKQSLNLEHHAKVFQTLYNSVDGFKLSRQARLPRDAMEYTYGEIEFIPFIALLSLINPDENTVFYDLGCGVGKAVLACAMVYPVKQSIGIELFPELYQCACQQAQLLAEQIDYANKAKNIHFMLSDFLTANLEEATLIFINATAFMGTTWEKLCQKIHELAQVDIIITTSKPLISELFIPKIHTNVQMSWGSVSAYIHYRKTN